MAPFFLLEGLWFDTHVAEVFVPSGENVQNALPKKLVRWSRDSFLIVIQVTVERQHKSPGRRDFVLWPKLEGAAGVEGAALEKVVDRSKGDSRQLKYAIWRVEIMYFRCCRRPPDALGRGRQNYSCGWGAERTFR